MQTRAAERGSVLAQGVPKDVGAIATLCQTDGLEVVGMQDHVRGLEERARAQLGLRLEHGVHVRICAPRLGLSAGDDSESLEVRRDAAARENLGVLSPNEVGGEIVEDVLEEGRSVEHCLIGDGQKHGELSDRSDALSEHDGRLACQ